MLGVWFTYEGTLEVKRAGVGHPGDDHLPSVSGFMYSGLSHFTASTAVRMAVLFINSARRT